MDCYFCSKTTSHKFVIWGYSGNDRERKRTAYSHGGQPQEKQELGSFYCCTSCEKRTRDDIQRLRDEAEGAEGWNLARMTNIRKGKKS